MNGELPLTPVRSPITKAKPSAELPTARMSETDPLLKLDECPASALTQRTAFATHIAIEIAATTLKSLRRMWELYRGTWRGIQLSVVGCAFRIPTSAFPTEVPHSGQVVV